MPSPVPAARPSRGFTPWKTAGIRGILIDAVVAATALPRIGPVVLNTRTEPRQRPGFQLDRPGSGDKTILTRNRSGDYKNSHCGSGRDFPVAHVSCGGNGRLLGLRFLRFEQLRQPGFGAGGGVAVDQMLGGGLVESLDRQTKCYFRGFFVFALDGLTAFLDHGSQSRPLSSVKQTAGLTCRRAFLALVVLGMAR